MVSKSNNYFTIIIAVLYVIEIIVYVVNSVVLHPGAIFRIKASFPQLPGIWVANSYSCVNHWKLHLAAGKCLVQD